MASGGAQASCTAKIPSTADACHVAAVARLLSRFLLPAKAEYSASDWNTVRAVRADSLRWGEGPIMLQRATPEGDMFSMPGHAVLDGQQVQLAANGARTMVFNIRMLDPTPGGDPDDVPAGLREAGFRVAAARCPIDGRYPDKRRWYQVRLKGKRPAYLYAGPLKTGGTGYALYQNSLPTMSERDAVLYTDDCTSGGGQSSGFRTGSQAAVSLIDTLLRSASASASLSWQEIEKLPSIRWYPPPKRQTLSYPPGGTDTNPYSLFGALKTPTTNGEITVTGNARAATRFYLRNLTHVRLGQVFDGLRAKGYRIRAIRCGKRYLKSSENWFGIGAPGRRPVVLYRSIFNDDGYVTIGYVLRMDNVMPPIEPGQYPAPATGCPDMTPEPDRSPPSPGHG